jgi:lipoprotein NlpD
VTGDEQDGRGESESRACRIPHYARAGRARAHACRCPCPLGTSSALLFFAVLLALLTACSSAPTKAPATYTVKRGDTLSEIASRHRLNYKDIARWNGIARDYVIYPGQKLKLYPAGKQRVASTSTPARATPGASTRPPKTSQIVGPPVRWQWPVIGGKATLTTRPNGGYGLTISGSTGDEVRAAGDGRVVYTGSGLLGYGQLVIVKHSETYLSAYGHAKTVAVGEGEAVKAGQPVATMGAGPQGEPLLYFEIRINGSPGNPLELLPPR